MKLEGVFVCKTDLCRYGMQVKTLPNTRPTMWVTNCKHIARELQLRCSGDHEHEPLMGGIAKDAAVYPKPLCQSVVRGLTRHLREVGKLHACKLEIDSENVVLVGEKED